jgi:hypothetical protein
MLRRGAPPVYARVVAPFCFAPRSHILASADTGHDHALRHPAHEGTLSAQASAGWTVGHGCLYRAMEHEVRLPTHDRDVRSARGERESCGITRTWGTRDVPGHAMTVAPAITGITRSITGITRSATGITRADIMRATTDLFPR